MVHTLNLALLLGHPLFLYFAVTDFNLIDLCLLETKRINCLMDVVVGH